LEEASKQYLEMAKKLAEENKKKPGGGGFFKGLFK
jgi:hypothetical protein